MGRINGIFYFNNIYNIKVIMIKTYFIASENMIKIGKTSGSVKNRLKQLSTGNSHRLWILGYVSGDREKELHKMFSFFFEYR